MTPFLLLVALIGGPSGPAAASPHPMSVSRLEIRFQDGGLDLRYRVQARTLLEVKQLALDRDRNGELSETELAAGWGRIREYLGNGLLLTADGSDFHPRFEGYERVEGLLANQESGKRDWVETRARLDLPGRPRTLAVACALFFDDGNPDHRILVDVEGLAGKRLDALLDAQRPRTEFQSRPFLDYLGFGFHHVLDGFDHLAFLLALLLGVAGLRALLGAVTAFTLAHSLTLALSALGILVLPPIVVEPGIALSIVAVLWIHIALGPRRSRPWIPAFAFGLLHGFGFASVLGQVGLPGGARATALFAFNLGVEGGQLAFVLPVVALGLSIRRSIPRLAEEGRRPLGALLGAVALVFFGRAVATFAFGPGPWAVLTALGASLGLGLVLIFVLRHVRDPRQRPLRPLVALSCLLAGMFLFGSWLGA